MEVYYPKLGAHWMSYNELKFCKVAKPHLTRSHAKDNKLVSWELEKIDDFLSSNLCWTRARHGSWSSRKGWGIQWWWDGRFFFVRRYLTSWWRRSSVGKTCWFSGVSLHEVWANQSCLTLVFHCQFCGWESCWSLACCPNCCSWKLGFWGWLI